LTSGYLPGLVWFLIGSVCGYGTGSKNQSQFQFGFPNRDEWFPSTKPDTRPTLVNTYLQRFKSEWLLMDEKSSVGGGPHIYNNWFSHPIFTT